MSGPSADGSTRRWKVVLDGQYGLVYVRADGAMVRAADWLHAKTAPGLLQHVTEALRPYPDSVRPRDVRGESGGLIFVRGGRRAVIVGDLHGRFDNLEHILRDKHNLRDVLAGDAHLIFTGDALHPRSSAATRRSAYEGAICAMMLIVTLKAQNPSNVHYLIGNHDNVHVGGRSAAGRQARQDDLFEHFVIRELGEAAFEAYRRFVLASPVAAKLQAPGGSVLLVHAGLSPRVLDERGLVNIFVRGRAGRALEELLWTRNYDEDVLDRCLRNVGAKFVITGHTAPTRARAARYGLSLLGEGVCAHVHERQVILSAQHNTFGYVDLDMTRPLPDRVSDLRAPDGRPAFRVLRPRTALQSLAPPATESD